MSSLSSGRHDWAAEDWKMTRGRGGRNILSRREERDMMWACVARGSDDQPLLRHRPRQASSRPTMIIVFTSAPDQTPLRQRPFRPARPSCFKLLLALTLSFSRPPTPNHTSIFTKASYTLGSHSRNVGQYDCFDSICLLPGCKRVWPF
jgi:hypothetical protein